MRGALPAFSSSLASAQVDAGLLHDLHRDVVALDAVDGLLRVVDTELVLGENEDCRTTATVSDGSTQAPAPRATTSTHSTRPGRRYSTS